MKTNIILFLGTLMLINLNACSFPNNNPENDNTNINIEGENLPFSGTGTDETKYSPDSRLPQWAQALGLSEPAELDFRKSLSSIKSEAEDGFNAVKLFYKGDLDVVKEEAEKIAQKANLAIKQEYQMGQKKSEDTSITTNENAEGEETPIPTGIMYSNFTLTDNQNNLNEQYQIIVNVNPDGYLEISAVDFKKSAHPDPVITTEESESESESETELKLENTVSGEKILK